MKKILLLLAFAFPFLTLRAQDEETEPPQWLDVSALCYTAEGGSDPSHVLQQFLLFSAETVDANEALFNDLLSLMEEINQSYVNQAVPDYLKEMETSILAMREQFKDNPQIQAQVDEAYREYLKEKKAVMAEKVTSEVNFSSDPAVMLRKLKALAINHKLYTGWSDAGNGMFAVTEAPRYNKFNATYFDKVEVADKDYYKWGMIDAYGRQILPAQYGPFGQNGTCYPDDDVIFLKKEDGGVVHSGAVSYSGRVRIPFIYDRNVDGIYRHTPAMPFEKNGKIGWVDLNGKVVTPFEYVSCSLVAFGWVVSKDDENFGFVSEKTCKLSIPLKYKELADDGPEFLRFDGKVDVYDRDGNFIRTRESYYD